MTFLLLSACVFERVTNIAIVGKEKALHWLGALQAHPGTELTNEELISAAKIINNFEKPRIEGVNSWRRKEQGKRIGCCDHVENKKSHRS